MYKVFVENVPIIFTNFKPEDKFKITVHSSEIEDIVQFVSQLGSKGEVFVFCDDLSAEFNRIFSQFDKIDAAGGIVVRKKRVLVIKRHGKWDLPKGKIEIEEEPEAAAVREIEEECGIQNPTITSFICNTYHTYFFKGNYVLKNTYWYQLHYSGSKKLSPQKEEDITNAKWLKIKRIKKVRKNTYLSICDVLDQFEEIVNK